MKKFIAAAALLALYQSWGSINNFIFHTPDYVNAGGGVVLYATEWCGYCQQTRELFAANDIEYVEYDIEKSSDRHREYRQLGGRGVPLINVGGTVIHGYSPASILTAVEQN